MFDPITPRTVVDDCADVIRDAILRGEISPGERLPPERQLAEQLGVNRVTVRSALTRLAASNLVTTRQGSGHVVQDFRSHGGPDLLPGLLALSADHEDVVETARDLLLVRRHLALAVLDRVVASGTAPRLGAVREAIDRFVAVASGDPDVESLAAADMAVLRALLDATGSPVLQLCFNPVLQVVAHFDRLRDAIYADPASNVAGYMVLARWLEAPRAQPVEGVAALLARRDALTLKRLAASAGEPR